MRLSKNASCTRDVWCFCAQVIQTILFLLSATTVFFLSWCAFYAKTTRLDGSGSVAYVCEFTSVLLAVAAYLLAFSTVLRCVRCALPTRAAVAITRLCLGRSAHAELEFLNMNTRTSMMPSVTEEPHSHCSDIDEPEDALPSAKLTSLPTATTTSIAVSPLPTASATATRATVARPGKTGSSRSISSGTRPPTRGCCCSCPCRARPLGRAMVIALCLLTAPLIHATARYFVLNKHRLSQELLTASVRVCADVAVVVVLSVAALARGVRGSARVGLLTAQEVRFVTVIGVVMAVWLVLWSCSGMVYRAWNLNTKTHLNQRLLGGDADICEAVGMTMDKSLTRAVVWPAILPRRTFNFFTGSERCDPHDRFHPLAWLDPDTHTLVLSPTCWDGQTKPRVYVERPVNNDLYRFPEHTYARAFTADLDNRFGGPTTPGFVVHRHSKSKRITEVEVEPSRLKPADRPPAPADSAEARVRAHWLTSSPSSVLTLPLGESVTYFVRCPSLDPLYEEMYLYPRVNGSEPLPPAPRTPDPPEGPSHGGTVGVTEPPGNVLFIVFDSTSRSEVLRSLPLFSAWLRDFQAREAAKGANGYLVAEPAHHSAVGCDTRGNAPVFLTGETFHHWEWFYAIGDTHKLNALPYVFTADAKQRYGEGRVRTSLTHGMCEDLYEGILRAPVHAGAGGRAGSTDMYTYTPFCHQEYGSGFGNLQGPYSIHRRCIDSRPVHHYLLNHTTYLMKHRVRRAKKPTNDTGEFFFDMTYFMDAHEGTHGVLNLVDYDLTAFMTHLEQEVRFFDNPLNTFIFGSDHGSHMGYYHMNNAGQFENTNPVFVMMVHPAVLNRVDAMKQRTEGTSARHLQKRMSQFSSNLDVHLTLRDILGVPELRVNLNKERNVPPSSYFEPRDVSPRQCSDYRSTEPALCTLSFCQEKQPTKEKGR